MDLSNLAGMFSNLTGLDEIISELQDELAKIHITGEAAGGQVTVTLNGQRDAINVYIDPELLTRENQTMVQAFVAGALNDAERKLEKVLGEKQQEYFMQNFGKLSNMFKK